MTCRLCDGYQINNCLSCGIQGILDSVNKSCSCEPGFHFHKHDCVSACPSANSIDPEYTLNALTNTCEIKCKTCQNSCSSDGLYCISCDSNFFIY